MKRKIRTLAVCSYHFDIGSAEGICTGRLVRALLEGGLRVTLITSKEASSSFSHPNLHTIKISSWPQGPHRVIDPIARLSGSLRLPGPHYAWLWKVGRVILPEKPDLIYGRALPFSSVAAARLLARRIGCPFVAHFGDPLPTPWDTDKNSHSSVLPAMRVILSEAAAVSFSTAQAAAYQEKIASIPLTGKAFTLPHICPPPAFLPTCKPLLSTFAYFGLFYGKRSAKCLLEGFSRHLNHYPDSRFMFVGTDVGSVLPDAQRLNILHAIQVIPRVEDVRSFMAQARILVAYDSDFGEPLFLTTKLIEALAVDRIVLLVSPAASPGSNLVKRWPETVVHASSQTPDAVCDALNRAVDVQPSGDDFESRFRGMAAFSSESICQTFLKSVETCID